jgi:hypothetical protein
MEELPVAIGKSNLVWQWPGKNLGEPRSRTRQSLDVRLSLACHPRCPNSGDFGYLSETLAARARGWPVVSAIIVQFLFVILTSGCTNNASAPPPTFSVTGKVFDANEKPLTGGIIQFISQENPTLNMSAMIAADGTYELTTIHGNENLPGAIAGKCQVLVTPPFSGGEVPQTITLPEPVTVGPRINAIDIHLP